ncbi:hypothetical protein DFH06DRAFT_1099335 [Mycena polygramma]|nr:hypothetical protein DFH06DRAFT_1099335 [Mycena polygramma]
MPTLDESLSESEVYCCQMLRQKRGFPLYIPNPQTLPPEYEERGIAIGDVGSVTADGEFDFYFNIFLPAEHPINADNTPEDFSPMYPCNSKDIFHRNYGIGHYLSTSTVRKVVLDPPFAFRCDGPQGVILALPDGSRVQKLRNVENMRTYAAKHADSWYKYIKGTRGRELTNGDLYLVTGCEKTRSWAMASYHTVREPFQLFLKPTTIAGATYSPYRWGGIQGQIDPSRSRSYDPPFANSPGNQAIFIHGWSISLPTGLWGTLFGAVQTLSIVDFHSLLNPPDGSSATNSRGSFFSWAFDYFAGRSTTGGNRHAEEPRGVVLSDLSTPSAVFNPAKLINEYILYKATQGTGVVMSHDDDWGRILGDATDLQNNGATFLASDVEPGQPRSARTDNVLASAASVPSPLPARVRTSSESHHQLLESLTDTSGDEPNFDPENVVFGIFGSPRDSSPQTPKDARTPEYSQSPADSFTQLSPCYSDMPPLLPLYSWRMSPHEWSQDAVPQPSSNREGESELADTIESALQDTGESGGSH